MRQIKGVGAFAAVVEFEIIVSAMQLSMLPALHDKGQLLHHGARLASGRAISV